MDSWVYWVAGLVLVVGLLITVAAQNRRLRPPSYPGSPPPAIQRGPAPPAWQDPPPATSSAQWGRDWDQAPAAAAAPPAGPEAPILITNPYILQAMQNALKRNSPEARYIVRDGDKLYLSFATMPDTADRQDAYDLMRRVEAGEQVGIRAMFRLAKLLSQLSK